MLEQIEEWMMIVATCCLPGWHIKLKMMDLPRVVENSFVSDDIESALLVDYLVEWHKLKIVLQNGNGVYYCNGVQ